MNIPFLSGPARYEPRGQWRPVQALVATIVIVLAVVFGALVAIYAAGYTVLGASYEQASEQHSEAVTEFGVALAAVLAALLAWFAAGLYGDRPREVLQLDGPAPSPLDVVMAISGYTLLYSVAAALRHSIDPSAFLADFVTQNTSAIQILGEAYWPLLFPAVATTSIGLDILFYGFLLSGLTKSRWGFWPSVVLMALVLCYAVSPSIVSGTQELMLFVYVCWLTWRTGRIWLAIFCNVWGVSANVLISAVYVWG